MQNYFVKKKRENDWNKKNQANKLRPTEHVLK